MVRKCAQTLCLSLFCGTLLFVATGEAHVGFSSRQRIDINGTDVLVRFWADYAHARKVSRGDLAAMLPVAAAATRIETAKGDCTLECSSAQEFGQWMFEFTFVFNCPAPPARLLPQAAYALDAGPMQHIDLRIEGRVHGSVRTPRPVIDVPGPGWSAWLVGLGIAGLLAATAAAFASAISRYRRRPRSASSVGTP